MQQFLKAKELAERWQCSQMHVYRLVKAGELPATKLGTGVLRFNRDDILAFEEQSRQVAA